MAEQPSDVTSLCARGGEPVVGEWLAREPSAAYVAPTIESPDDREARIESTVGGQAEILLLRVSENHLLIHT